MALKISEKGSDSMAMKKFPVTAADGTQFRVSLKEYEDDLLGEHYIKIRLYAPRKRFGFRWVYKTKRWSKADGVYDHNNPDYVSIAQWAVSAYYAALDKSAMERQRQAEVNARRSAAQNAFTAWDGKITEKGER